MVKDYGWLGGWRFRKNCNLSMLFNWIWWVFPSKEEFTLLPSKISTLWRVYIIHNHWFSWNTTVRFGGLQVPSSRISFDLHLYLKWHSSTGVFQTFWQKKPTTWFLHKSNIGRKWVKAPGIITFLKKDFLNLCTA